MRLLVCGGRHYAGEAGFDREMNAMFARVGYPIVIITGCAGGADRLARQWANSHGVPLKVFKADWTAHGRAAGPKRNQRMLDEGQPDFVLAFPGGRGTADMVRRAVTRSPAIPTWKVPA